MIKVKTNIKAVMNTIGRKANSVMQMSFDDGMEKCAEVVWKKALYYVPKDTGELAESAVIQKIGVGIVSKVVVEFKAPHALFVHEIPHYRHEPPTCFKFLERAVRETRGTCISIMRREIKARVVGTMSNQKEFDVANPVKAKRTVEREQNKARRMQAKKDALPKKTKSVEIKGKKTK